MQSLVNDPCRTVLVLYIITPSFLYLSYFFFLGFKVDTTERLHLEIHIGRKHDIISHPMQLVASAFVS